METIKVGDTIRVKENVTSELERMKFMDPSALDERIGQEYEALDIWSDPEQTDGVDEKFVTIDLCCEVPIAACELVS